MVSQVERHRVSNFLECEGFTLGWQQRKRLHTAYGLGVHQSRTRGWRRDRTDDGGSAVMIWRGLTNLLKELLGTFGRWSVKEKGAVSRRGRHGSCSEEGPSCLVLEALKICEQGNGTEVGVGVDDGPGGIL